jgi:hypothetical protein
MPGKKTGSAAPDHTGCEAISRRGILLAGARRLTYVPGECTLTLVVAQFLAPASLIHTLL